MTHQLIVSILLILTVAWGLGYLFSRLGLPAMLGQLLAGVVLGPPLLGLVAPTAELALLAEFGVFFAMFYAGMEMDPKELVEHLRISLAAALGGFILPFALGFLTVRMFGGTVFQCLFVGMAISVTALPVQSIILKSMRINRTEIGHIVIGATVANDVLALIGLSVLLGLARTGTLAAADLLVILLKNAAFFGFTIAIGQFVMPRLTKGLTDESAKGFTFAMTAALALAYLAELAGLHLIMGAFLAGQFVRREIMDEKVYEAIADRFYGIAYGFLVPIFFASLAFHLDIIWTWNFVFFTLVLTAMAIIGKIVGAGLPIKFLRYGRREAAVVGFGMNARGAVELVIVTVVLQASHELTSSGVITQPLLTRDQFSAIVLMAFISSLMAPLTLKWAVIRACRPDEKADFCQLMEDAPPS